MNPSSILLAAAILLIAARWAAQFWLSRLNEKTVRAHASAIPDALKGVVDDATYATSVKYTLARSRFGQIEDAFDAALLAVVLCSGLLPWAFRLSTNALGTSAVAMAAFLFIVGVVLTLPGLPFQWYDQFRLEQRFWLQHHHAPIVVGRPPEGPRPRDRPRLPASAARPQAGAMDRPILVGLGMGRPARLPARNAGGCAGADHAAFQQVHPARRRRPARPLARAWPPHRVFRAEHPGDGRQPLAPAIPTPSSPASAACGKSSCSIP